MTTPEQRVEEALEFARTWAESGAAVPVSIKRPIADLANEIFRLRKELSSAMENFVLAMARKDGEIRELGGMIESQDAEIDSGLGEIDALKEQVRVMKPIVDAAKLRCGDIRMHCELCELLEAYAKSNTGGA